VEGGNPKPSTANRNVSSANWKASSENRKVSSKDVEERWVHMHISFLKKRCSFAYRSSVAALVSSGAVFVMGKQNSNGKVSAKVRPF